MAKQKAPLKRLTSTTTLFTAPGLLVLGILLGTGLLGLQWATLGAIGCIAVAIVLAVPVARDLALIEAYGDALARGEQAPQPDLFGWAPATEIAARFYRLTREAERREQNLRDGMVASEMVFDGLPQPLLLVDSSRRVMRVNRAVRELIGTDPSGNDLASAFRDPRVLEAVDAVLGGRSRREASFALQDPVERYFSVQVVALRRPAADGATVLIAFYDLTERRRAEQMRGDFIANASHELRTPLATLIGFIETLRGPARDDPDAQQEFLRLMHDQASRMSRLVNDLLSLSAIELNEHSPPSATADTARVLRSVIASLQIEAANKKMKIVAEIEPGLPPLRGEEDQLTQLFQNLIDNAIKYGRRESEIRVTARFDPEVPATLGNTARSRAQGVIRIAVADQGEGIPAEHIPRLTERFYRVDTARSRAIGGTGLGLAIVKHILNRHRGVLEIESEEGVGSTFAVCLPLFPAPEAETAESDRKHAGPTA